MKGRLLVVEDDRDIANMLRLYLTGQGYQVHLTPHGRDALSLTRLELPHLVLLDIILPDIDGYAVCRALRTSPRTSHVPIIFLTQKDERSDRITGLQLGVDDYITKPFDIEELALRIQNVISRAERDRLTDPRTGLPAARLIQEQAARLLGQEDWALLDCRIEGFERALDVLGSAAGDEVLRSTAHLIGQVVDGLGTPDDFLGHDWAGRFTVTTNAIGAEAIADRLRTRFDDEVEGIQARAATLSPRAGPPEPPPRMFLAVGVLNASEGSFGSVEELMEAGARARRRDAYERTS